MSVASRIEEMYQHVDAVYNVLELAGKDLTNVDKNLVNLTYTWRERLLYFMNNGTNEVWNNWTKVNGTGTTLSLNNTEEAPMSLVYKGNTSQTGTPTPSSPIPVQVVSGDNTIEVCGRNLINPNALIQKSRAWADGVIQDNVNNYTRTDYIPVKANTSYYLTHTFGSSSGYPMWCYDENKNPLQVVTATGTYDVSSVLTTVANTKYVIINFWQPTIENNTPMLVESNEAIDYIPYEGASYPISLGYENLVKLPYYSNGGTYAGVSVGVYPDGSILVNGTGSGSSTGYFNLASSDNLITLEPGTYTLSIGNVGVEVTLVNQATSTNTVYFSRTETTTYKTFTVTETTSYRLYLAIRNNASYNNVLIKPMLEKGSIAHSYTPYGKAIELCKIGTYQDKIDKSKGINKLAPTQDFTETKNGLTFTGHNGVYTISGTATASTFSTAYNVANYTIQEGDYLHMKNSMALSGSEIDITFTDNTVAQPGLAVANRIWSLSNYVGKTIKQITFYVSNGLTTNFYLTPMILNTSTATDFEPYGTGWYLKKEIGKYTFTGNENWVTHSYGTNSWALQLLSTVYNANKLQIISNIFKGIPASERSDDQTNIMYFTSDTIIVARNTTFTTKADIQSATNGNYVYYALATPIYEEIEDTTLLSQLEALKKSYEEKTNISQVNNDMPFELDVVALSK